jgi:hypothetical protein
MLKSYGGRAELEVFWRKDRRKAIQTVARFMGQPALKIAAALSSRISGGRTEVRSQHTGELLGYT